MYPIKLISVLAAITVAMYSGWQVLFPVYSFHYRLSLEVETPEGPKTGSSVIEVRSSKSGAMSIIGEAVVVDLGFRGVLFALLRGHDSASSPGHTIYVNFPPAADSYPAAPENLRRYAKSSERAELSPNRIPELVRFRNTADPKSVEYVDPVNLSASFGIGVRLLRATIELTRDPVTNGVEQWLPWLNQFWDLKFDGGRYENFYAANRLANSLSSGAFKAGTRK